MTSDDATIYKVVVNQEEQYSIWFADRELPAGWKDTSKEGVKDECLTYVEQVWKDIARAVSGIRWTRSGDFMSRAHDTSIEWTSFVELLGLAPGKTPTSVSSLSYLMVRTAGRSLSHEAS